MTLQQLKYAITVAQTGTITEAAEKLYISQPSLTNAIHELEKEMNSMLKTKIKLQAEVQNSRSGKTIRIFSEGDEKELKGTIAFGVFKQINVDFWGGSLNDGGQLVFFPKVAYEHWSGGTNGTDFCWDMLRLNIGLTKSTWIFGRKLL